MGGLFEYEDEKLYTLFFPEILDLNVNLEEWINLLLWNKFKTTLVMVRVLKLDKLNLLSIIYLFFI